MISPKVNLNLRQGLQAYAMFGRRTSSFSLSIMRNALLGEYIVVVRPAGFALYSKTAWQAGKALVAAEVRPLETGA